jgi:hypothetical protein
MWGPPNLGRAHPTRTRACVQVRLEGMFPELSAALGDDQPSWLQWAFACVRSRAIK